MTENKLITEGESLFENIKHVNEYGQEYWTARDLIPILGYNEVTVFHTISCRCTIWCKLVVELNAK